MDKREVVAVVDNARVPERPHLMLAENGSSESSSPSVSSASGEETEQQDADSASEGEEGIHIETEDGKAKVMFGGRLLGVFHSLRPGVVVADEFDLDRSYDHGFVVVGPKENWKLRLGGRLIVRGTDIQSESSVDDNVTVQSARLFINMGFWDYFEFRIQGELSGSALISEIEGKDSENNRVETDVKDIYLNVDYFKWGQLRLGQFKVPFSRERLQSSNYLDFVGRSVGPRNIARPTRDIGVMIHGRLKDDSIGYQVAVTNGTGPNTSDDNSEKDVSARFVFQPFRDAENDIRSGMYAGISGTWGNMNKDMSDVAFSTVTGLSFVEFANGTTGEGDRIRLGAEFIWLMGPASIKAECMKAWLDDIRMGALEKDSDAYSWYVSGTYLLTGEKKIRGKIVPDRPFSLFKRNWGAWELAARYSQFRTDSNLFRAGMATGTNKAGVLELGINWYLNEFFRLTLNYEHAEFDDDFVIDGKAIDEEDAVLVQLQFEF